MFAIVASVVMYMVGIIMTYRSTRNLFSIPMLVLYIWAFGLISGINRYMIEGQFLTSIVVGLASFSIGLGSRFFSMVLKFNFKRDLRIVTPQRLSIGIINKGKFKIVFGVSLALFLYAAFIILKRSPLLNPGLTKIEMVIPGMGPLLRLFKTGLPVLSIMSLTFAIQSHNFVDRVFTVLMFGITVLILMLTGYRGYVLWFGVLVAITIGYIKPRSRKLKFYVAVLLIIGIVAGLVVLYLTLGPGYKSFERSFRYLFWTKTTYEATYGLDYVLYSLVPENGFYMGETMFWDFEWIINELTQGVIFPNPHLSLGRYIPFLILGHENPYTVTTMLIGDLYANWGLLGVVLGCFFYGTVIEFLYIAILRAKKTIISLPFLAYLSWIFVHAASTGYPIAFFISEFFSLCLVYSIVILFYFYFYLPFIHKEQILSKKRRESNVHT